MSTALQISSDIKYHLIPVRDCLSMPLNMKLSFAHSNGAEPVEGAWPVMGFASHQQVHGGPPAVVMLGAPTSLASTHYGDRSAPRRRHTRRR
jgi:hypothetical protein